MTEPEYTGVLDRIVDGRTAVLLLEADGVTVEQLDVDVERVPVAGRHEGAVFDVTLEGGDLGDLDYRPGTEEERRRAAQKRFDRLARRLGDSDSGREGDAGEDDSPSDAGDPTGAGDGDGDSDGDRTEDE